jgi:hypothetical protein
LTKVVVESFHPENCDIGLINASTLRFCFEKYAPSPATGGTIDFVPTARRGAHAEERRKAGMLSV